MKKRMIYIVVLVIMAVSLAACGKSASKGEVTSEVTWDELLAANKLDAVFEQTGGFCSTTKDGDGETYISYAAMVDGELICSNGILGYTEDLRNGIVYNASEDGMGKYINIIAPTADLNELVDGAYGDELGDYQVPEKIYVNEGQYFVNLYQEDNELGFIIEGCAYFDTETLLLDRVELVQRLGSFEYGSSTQMSYNVGADFDMVSYDRIVNAEDTVDLTVHYPDGSVSDITVDREVTVMAYYPGHLEGWSVCWDEACTGSIDDLGWITGDHGDVYLCEGYIASAPPSLDRVLKKSSFETMFKENYDTYFQNTSVMDKDGNVVETRDLSWYVDEKAGLSLNFEIKNADYNVIQSGRARENAWYSWTEEDGYKVDFFDEFSYAESLIKEYRRFLYEEQLGAPMEQEGELYPYYIPYEETVEGGMINEYKYCISTDFDYIERIELTRRDSDLNIVGYETCYIGGNGPISGDLDIFAEISAPSDVEAVKLTVVSPAGEKTYSIRKDAEISWKGEALYSDEACTEEVYDLNWAENNEAKVYVK